MAHVWQPDMQEKREISTEDLPPSDWPMAMSVEHCLEQKLMEESPAIIGNVILGQKYLGYIGKVAEGES